MGGAYSRSLPDLHWQVYTNSSQEQILAELLSLYAEHLRSAGKSLSSWNAAASAVSHYNQACHPTPQSIIRNTAKAFARTNPNPHAPDTVPNLQKILDIIHTIYQSQTPKNKRTHFISLLLL